jgi:murein L,D-transpeptidase YafK
MAEKVRAGVAARAALLTAALAGLLLAGCTASAPPRPPEARATAVPDRPATPQLDPAASRATETPRPEEADKVVVVKALRELRLLADGEVFRTYPVALGRAPVGDKLWEGDGRTPEGRYTLDFKNENSAFYRSIRVSYPNAQDWREARALGVHPGSDIMIHGLKPEFAEVGKGHLRADWTEGCIAVTNRQMDEIWSLVPVGTPIVIRP